MCRIFFPGSEIVALENLGTIETDTRNGVGDAAGQTVAVGFIMINGAITAERVSTVFQ